MNLEIRAVFSLQDLHKFLWIDVYGSNVLRFLLFCMPQAMDAPRIGLTLLTLPKPKRSSDCF